MSSMEDDILIHGDNIQAIQKLKKDYRNKVKLMYLDPPYGSNTTNEHYSDVFELKEYQEYMLSLLKNLYPLLKEDGYLVCQIDSQRSYLIKELLDKVFQESNFRGQMIVSKNDHKLYHKPRYTLISGYDCLLCYSKNDKSVLPPLIEHSRKEIPGQWANFYTSSLNEKNQYKLWNQDIKVGSWRKDKKWAEEAIENYNNLIKGLENNIKDKDLDKKIKAYKEKHKSKKEINFLRYKNHRVEYYIYPSHEKHVTDNWSDIDIRGYQTNFEHEVSEALLERIIRWLSKENEIILDPFLGTGTSVVVATKLNRRWIGIEKQDYCKEIVLSRMNKKEDRIKYYEC